ncbi:unnamed protein product [Strongylus vulgaris]|uniref:FYVE-type domain-containing protein n=1 Tax=Strongylus vulgaris TaxID=40348 RepID=A0A3P7IBC4_STRVU|nr:unnamed protein product [Strongylus vulgaris]
MAFSIRYHFIVERNVVVTHFLCSSRRGTYKQNMSPVCCTNCRTKYSILNPEEGCSNCALSFCRRCLSHRALLPQFANKPVTVCSQCFEKLNAETLKNQISSRSGNWWGDGLPPPSMRQSVGMFLIFFLATSSQPLTLSEIEERLAALRGCDVELIRRPRCVSLPLFRLSLMKMAKERAEIEVKHDPANELERRHRALRGDGEEGPSSHAQQDQSGPVEGEGMLEINLTNIPITHRPSTEIMLSFTLANGFAFRSHHVNALHIFSSIQTFLFLPPPSASSQANNNSKIFGRDYGRASVISLQFLLDVRTQNDKKKVVISF